MNKLVLREVTGTIISNIFFLQLTKVSSFNSMEMKNFNRVHIVWQKGFLFFNSLPIR